MRMNPGDEGKGHSLGVIVTSTENCGSAEVQCVVLLAMEVV